MLQPGHGEDQAEEGQWLIIAMHEEVVPFEMRICMHDARVERASIFSSLDGSTKVLYN